METQYTKQTLGARIRAFVEVLDTSPDEVMFERTNYVAGKLQELEARLARLENPGAAPAKAIQREAG
jgi:hypothetical protein